MAFANGNANYSFFYSPAAQAFVAAPLMPGRGAFQRRTADETAVNAFVASTLATFSIPQAASTNTPAVNQPVVFPISTQKNQFTGTAY